MGRWQAVYTAGVLLPKPIAKCRYWHRSLQFRKLHEVKFTYLPQQMTISGQIKALMLPKNPVMPWREMALEDVPMVRELLMTSLRRCDSLRGWSIHFLTCRSHQMTGRQPLF